MSVVVCKVDKKNKTIKLACDSITVLGYTQRKNDNPNTSKVIKVNSDLMFGSVGLAEETIQMKQFLEHHKPKDATEDSILMLLSKFSKWKLQEYNGSSINNHFIFVCFNKAFSTNGFYVKEITEYDAIGAGSDFALTALYLGHPVKKAVEVACELSIYCELPVWEYIKSYG